MRWLVLLVLLAGFDHAAHDSKTPLDCKSCHVKGSTKVPRHAACFGACHGPAPKKKAAKVGALCDSCHAKTAASFDTTFDHAVHLGTTLAEKVDCAGCHAAKGHARCAECHGGDKLDACTTCHVATPATAVPRWLPDFDHQQHPKASCLDCHAAMFPAAAGDPVRLTGSWSCATCHDGKKAFATTEACTRCHTSAPQGVAPLVRPTATFSHAAHRGRGTGDCASCHTIDARGEASPPGHAACASCHADDFASATPTICAACHVAIEPWRKLVADAPPPPATEFGAQMPHRTHANRQLTCAGCHSVTDADRQRRPPHGHATCAACHTKDATPLLTDCDGCHRLGLVDARVQDRLAAKWSVRARFDHDAHATDCETCHTTLWEVDGAPPSPAKATCAGCHDGKAAFKMTGHACARCHGVTKAE